MQNEMVPKVLDALQKFINARPDLDPANYGCHPEQLRYSGKQERIDAWQSYRKESRDIAKDGTRVRRALREARLVPPNGELLADAFRRAFSGRLSWNGSGLEYCTGQYYPTEYRKAAASVLECYVSTARPKFSPEPGTLFTHVEQIVAASQRAGSHFFDSSSMRFFRSRVLSQVTHGPGGVFFVTSEKGPNEQRAFTVRKFDPLTADVDTFGPFNKWGREKALRVARIAAEYPDAAKEYMDVTA